MGKKKSIGLPGGPNEFLQDITQYVSVEGYKRYSEDVNNPFNIIDSGNITMEDVDFPVKGTDNLGNEQIMMPGMNYQFPGDSVLEVPMAQDCGNTTDIDKIYGGVVPEGNISSLSKESYEKLNDSEKYIYDLYTDQDGYFNQTIPHRSYDGVTSDIQYQDMLRMLKDSETDIIFKPSFRSKLEKKKYHIKDGDPYFRGHAFPNKFPGMNSDIHIPPVKEQDEYLETFDEERLDKKYGLNSEQMAMILYKPWMVDLRKNNWKNTEDYNVEKGEGYSEGTMMTDRDIYDAITDYRFGDKEKYPDDDFDWKNDKLMDVIEGFMNENYGKRSDDPAYREESDVIRNDNLRQFTNILVAELAHTNKDIRTGFLDWLQTQPSRVKRMIQERGFVDHSNYTDPSDYEYKTHYGPNSSEIKLLQKYLTSPASEIRLPERDLNVKSKGGSTLPKAQKGATISQYEEPAWYEKAVDYLASPMTALGYTARNQDLPDSLPINAENRNTYDSIIDAVNPFAWAKYATSAGRNVDQGEYLDATFDALGAIPIVPAWLAKGKNAAKNLPLDKIDDLVEVVTANGSVKKIPRKDAIKLNRVEDANASNTSFSEYEDGNWFNDKMSTFYVNRTKNAMSPVSYDLLDPKDPRRLITMYMDPSDAKNFNVVKGTTTERALNMSGGMGNMPHPNEYVIPPALVKQIRETGKIPGASTFIGDAEQVMKNLSDFYKKYGGDISGLDKKQLGGLLKHLKPYAKKGFKYLDDFVKNNFKEAGNAKFVSEIDWMKFNKSIPENKILLQEYNLIEETTKANGTWMKNADGSAFAGTPEQFVQMKSGNFQKAFGNSKVQDIVMHKTDEVFDVFDPKKIGSAKDDGFYGRGFYFHPEDIAKKYDDFYGKIPMPSYVNIVNPYTGKQTIEVGKQLAKDIDGRIIMGRSGSDVVRPVEYMSTNPNNIKSAIGNDGMFDLTNPNIYKQQGGESLEEYQDKGEVEKNLDAINKQLAKSTIASGKTYNPYRDIDEKSQKRRTELTDAINFIVNDQGGDENLRDLLIMTAFMENSYGANADAYGRDYTRGPMSIDDIAYKHMFEIRKGANDYTSSQKKYIDWFDSMGYDLEHMDEHLRNDIKANVAASRYQYGTNKNPLPSSKDPQALYNYYMDTYNRTDENHYDRFLKGYNEFIGKKEFGGSVNKYLTYKKFMNGGYTGNDKIEAEKIYDKLNRMHYRDAKQRGLSPQNYIMTNLLGNS